MNALEFPNGFGGFADDGAEYVLWVPTSSTGDGSPRLPPRPWVNIIANESIGSIVSETGSAHTWCNNSREHRVTPWSNDPITDPHGEALYVRDDDTGRFWSPTPGPAPGGGVYEVRHGLGASVFRYESGGLEFETIFTVHPTRALRIVIVRARETQGRSRRLSFFSYARLVLGAFAEDERPFIATERDSATGAVLARNRTAGPFSGAVAFGRMLGDPERVTVHATADRTTFLGRRGWPAYPDALSRRDSVLDGKVGRGLDPCIALQGVVGLDPRGEVGIAFLLGEGRDDADAAEILASTASVDAALESLAATRAYWRDLCGRVQVRTPSRALDILVNHWLPYQTLSCRIQARTAFYQSGGAYGFRDQLQDAAAMMHLDPGLTRRQILLHARHQFIEGDVLHWWHPPLALGIRTRFADDLLWLPYITAQYVEATGDGAVLDEAAGFVSAPLLDPGEDEVLLTPGWHDATASVYDHCCLALDRSLVLGTHGLPLFGTGDWNDAMNRVGREGRGESVWMGFFLVGILRSFAPLCEARGDEERAARYLEFAEELAGNLNEAGWDGAWYRRAYYDDGSPMGSAGSDECKIDALVQSWAVLSGAAPLERASAAMKAVEERLIDEKAGIIRLLTPAFDRTPKDPGYIKGYAPGVRENGGQYTHAALWVIRAAATLGWKDRAAHLLDLINPILHASTRERATVYQLEPYVVAADVYGEPPHVGRGGWSWYTGSSGWMYRVAIESILGVRWVGKDRILLRPCIPDSWPGFEIRLRVPWRGTGCTIVVQNTPGGTGEVASATLDGNPVAIIDGTADLVLPLDGGVHELRAIMDGPQETTV